MLYTYNNTAGNIVYVLIKIIMNSKYDNNNPSFILELNAFHRKTNTITLFKFILQYVYLSAHSTPTDTYVIQGWHDIQSSLLCYIVYLCTTSYTINVVALVLNYSLHYYDAVFMISSINLFISIIVYLLPIFRLRWVFHIRCQSGTRQYCMWGCGCLIPY
jgi:hypothetical protein